MAAVLKRTISEQWPPQFLETPLNFWKRPKAWKNGPLKDPKSEFEVQIFFLLPRIQYVMCFLQKTAPKLVKFGLGSPISDLHPPIGGHHPVLYFPTQITKKYSTAMCYQAV